MASFDACVGRIGLGGGSEYPHGHQMLSDLDQDIIENLRHHFTSEYPHGHQMLSDEKKFVTDAGVEYGRNTLTGIRCFRMVFCEDWSAEFPYGSEYPHGHQMLSDVQRTSRRFNICERPSEYPHGHQMLSDISIVSGITETILAGRNTLTGIRCFRMHSEFAFVLFLIFMVGIPSRALDAFGCPTRARRMQCSGQSEYPHGHQMLSDEEANDE